MSTGLWRDIAALVCHQLADRSLSIGSTPLPLCARCSGLYGGFMVGLLYQAATGRRAKGSAASRVLIMVSVGLLAALAAEALAEKVGFWAGCNWARLVLGLAAGTALSVLAATLCRRLFMGARATGGPLAWGVFAPAACLAGAVRLFPRALPTLAALSLAGLIAVYLCLNLGIAGAILNLHHTKLSPGKALCLIALTLGLLAGEATLLRIVGRRP